MRVSLLRSSGSVRSSRRVLLGGLSLSGLLAAACGGSTSGANEQKPDSATIVIIPLPKHDAGADTSAVAPDASVTHDTGASADAGVDAIQPPTDADLNTYPAFKPKAPQVVNAAGGKVLADPIFVPVIFAGDVYQAQIIDYMSVIGQSQYWATAVGEYGVHAATSATPIIMNETMPSSISDTQMQTWLSNRIGTDPRFGALDNTSVFDAGPFDAGSIDATAPLSPAAQSAEATPPANVVYVLFMPEGTTVSEGGGSSCTDFGGYHNSYFAPNGSDVVYAMVPRCASFGPTLIGLDAVTGTASHELAEAATDPLVGGNGARSAYSMVDDNDFVWEQVLGGGEIGDMCAQFPSAFYNPTEASMSAYKVQRIWSNASAAAGHDPCLPIETPAQGEPYYFNSVPNFGTVNVTFDGQNFPITGVAAPVGTPTTFEIDLFSDATTNGEPWQVEAFDANSEQGGQADLIFSPASVSGVNGDKLTLTVNNLGNDGRTVHPFILISTQGDQQNWWVGAVGN